MEYILQVLILDAHYTCELCEQGECSKAVRAGILGLASDISAQTMCTIKCFLDFVKVFHPWEFTFPPQIEQQTKHG